MPRYTRLILAIIFIGFLNGLWHLQKILSGEAFEHLVDRFYGAREYGNIVVLSLVGAYLLTEYVLKGIPFLSVIKNNFFYMSIVMLLTTAILYVSLMGIEILLFQHRLYSDA